MMRQCKITFDTLPSEIPIFPLDGVLLLPRGQLPLNIFEPRYLAMIDEAMRGNRLIGMIQPKEDGTLHAVGCAGRIFSYHETQDGRIEVVLNGICRFKIREELAQKDGYRRVSADWSAYAHDMEPMGCLDIDRAAFSKRLKTYFDQQGFDCSWEAIEKASDEKLITCLAMVCPFEAKEKQALLEAGCCRERAKLFMTLLEMSVTSACDCGHKH